jgi:hypothetical protein
MAPDDAKPVNAFSKLVDPRKRFPIHFDALMRDLFAHGEQPERWRLLDADEVRLDDAGQEVEFTLVKHGTEDVVWRRRVLVCRGKILGIAAC